MKKCFECKATEDVQEHHVVPASRGGTQTIPLCSSCHGKAHGRDSKGMNHSRLIKEGMARAKERGSKIGNPNLFEALLRSNQSNRARGQQTLSRVQGMIELAQSFGYHTTRDITDFLNRMGVKTPRGKEIYPMFVKRILEKIGTD